MDVLADFAPGISEGDVMRDARDDSIRCESKRDDVRDKFEALELGVPGVSVTDRVDSPTSISSSFSVPLITGEPLDQGVRDPLSMDRRIAFCAFSWSSSSRSTYFSGMRGRTSSSTKGGRAAAMSTLPGEGARLPGPGGCRLRMRSPTGPFTISRSKNDVYAFSTVSTKSSGPSAGPLRVVSVAEARTLVPEGNEGDTWWLSSVSVA